MKAIIQFELKDSKLTEQQLKEKLVDNVVNTLDDWVKGDGVINIDFVYTYIENEANNKNDIHIERDGEPFIN